MRKIIIERESIKRMLANKVSRQLRPQTRRALQLNLNGAVTVCGCCQCCGQEDPCACCSGNTPSTISVTLAGILADDCVDCPSFNTTYTLFQTVPGDPDDGTQCRKGYSSCFYIGTTSITTNCRPPFAAFAGATTGLEILCGGGFVTVNFYICGELVDITPVSIKWSNFTTAPFDCCSPFAGLTTTTVGDIIGCDFTGSSATVNFSC